MIKPPHLTDEEWLRQLTAEAQGKRIEDVPAPPPSVSLGAVLPRAAQIAANAGTPSAAVCNPKIWADDRGRFRRGEKFPRGPWQAACRAAAKARQLGDVLAPTILRICEVLAWQSSAAGQGQVAITFRYIAELTGCCVETARKAIRWLEAHGLVDTFNTLERVAGQMQRAANTYVLRMPEAAPAEQDAPAALDPIARVTATLARWASAFGLTPRAWGLNATPLRGAPAPA